MSEADSKRILDELKKIEEKMATKEDLNYLIDTIEIMSNPATMKQIKNSERDIAVGSYKEIGSVNDLL